MYVRFSRAFPALCHHSLSFSIFITSWLELYIYIHINALGWFVNFICFYYLKKWISVSLFLCSLSDIIVLWMDSAERKSLSSNSTWSVSFKSNNQRRTSQEYDTTVFSAERDQCRQTILFYFCLKRIEIFNR